MASSTTNAPVTSLAAFLAIKQQVAAANGLKSEGAVVPQPLATGAHSKEKLTYRQTVTIPNLSKPAVEEKSLMTNNSRQAKQIEVGLLEKKMEEINRKKEVKTIEALTPWKGFDNLNYGMAKDPTAPKPTPETEKPTAVEKKLDPQPPTKKVRHPSVFLTLPLVLCLSRRKVLYLFRMELRRKSHNSKRLSEEHQS